MTGPSRERPVIVLATRSAGKRRELAALLANEGVPVTDLVAAGVPEDPTAEAAIECHDTFEANALAKARYFRSRVAAGWVLAEDSGLCVDALGGAPGVQSKRWGGVAQEEGVALDAANTDRVLAALSAVGADAATERSASYVCVAVLLGPSGQCLVAEGRTAGRILPARRGTGGFGYDPVFWSTELGACFGEMAAAAKAAVSHRGRAVRRVLAAARDEFSSPR